MPKPDYSTWLTKAQAAEAIGVSTKTIEKFADDGKLQQTEWKRPEGGPRIVVYHPRDVERLRKERNPDAPAFVLPMLTDDKPASSSKAVAVRRQQPSPEQFIQILAAAVGASQSTSQTSQKQVRLAERLYLTVDQAAEYTGLGVSYIRRQVAEGRLKPAKGAGPHGADVLRRRDLEKL